MTCCVPLQGGYGLPFNIIGRTNEGPFTGGGGIHMAVPGYFDTFEIPVIRGRAFNATRHGLEPARHDHQPGAGEAILAGRRSAGGSSLDRRRRPATSRSSRSEPVRQIIGIVGDVRAGSIAQDPGPMMYLPLRADAGRDGTHT